MGTASSPEPGPEPSPGRPGLPRILATGAVMAGLVVTAFEGTVVTSAMPTIARELGGLDLYSWIFSAYLVASTLSVPLSGKLADRLGRRPVFTVGMALFLVGSALCGAAQSMGQLIAFRVIQGLGVGAIAPIGTTISADLYSLEERARVQGLFTGAWGFANVAGPAIGGFIVLHASWRWVFLVNLPVGLIAVALLLVSYRDPPLGAREPFDWQGGALAAIGIGAVLVALERDVGLGLGGRALGVAFAALATALFIRRQRRAPSPILPLEMLRDPLVRAGAIGSLFIGALIFVPAAYVPLWITSEGLGDALAGGSALVPMLAGWAVGSTLGVKVLVRRGVRFTALAALALVVIGATGLALVARLGLPLRAAHVALGVLGFGLGPAANAFLLGAQMRVGWSERGVVTSLVHAARMLGGSFAVAAVGAVGIGGAGAGAARCAALAVVAWASVVTAASVVPAVNQVVCKKLSTA